MYINKYIKDETNNLNNYKEILLTLIRMYANKRQEKLTKQKEQNILEFIVDSTENDFPFRSNNPEDYYDIYCSRHENELKND